MLALSAENNNCVAANPIRGQLDRKIVYLVPVRA